jgi:hypothetical protein
MAKQTWDTSRTGGGTYEFTQDAQGNYVLGSVGFQKLSKLNLPELQKEAVTTDTTKAAATASAQTKQAFGDVQPFYYDQKGEGGTDTQYTMKKEGDLSTETQPMVTGDTFAQARQAMTTDAAYKGTDIATKKEPDLPPWAQGADRRGWSMEAMQKVPEQTLQVGRQNIDQVLADRAKTEKAKPQIIKPSDRQPGFAVANLRKTEVTPTKLRNVKTSLKTLANTVGIALNPAVGIGKIILGAVKDTPMQTHDRQYFNTVGNTDRIAGNPATDLYAGMNRTSAFGDPGKAGDKRLATRRETAKRKGYDESSSFVQKTKAMEKQAIDHKKSQTSVMKNVPPSQRGGGGNGGGDGGRVICTELHRTHELSTKDWIRDTRFTFNTLTENHIKGYLIWAIPTVKYMKKYPKYRKIWKHIAQHRANDITWRLNEGKFDLLGRIYAGIGEPLCWLIGNFTGNKQINELNITNWRKA